MKIPHPKLLLPLAVLAAALLLGALLLVTAPEVENEPADFHPTTIRVATARPEAVGMVVRSQGTVAPRTESELVPEVSGRVVWTSPALVSGGFFEAGEPLLRIDAQDYENQLTKARAAVARARGDLDFARQNQKRLDGLAERDIASPSQLDDARRSARVTAASLDEARANLDQAQRDLGRTEILAPYSGRVREENVDVGQFVSRGAKVAIIYATDYVDVRLPIPDRQLAFLDLPVFRGEGETSSGPEVTLSARFAGGEHQWKGRIVRTEGEIDARSRMVHVVARVEDPYGAAEGATAPLAVGLFVQAEIAGPVVEEVVVLPREALRDDGSVLVLDEQGALRSRPVEVVRVDRDEVMVRDLPAGTRVNISTLQVFVEGMRARTADDPGGIAAQGAPEAVSEVLP